MNFFGIRDQFHGRQFFHGWGGGMGIGFWMIQVHYIYCALYFYYFYISSTSDHQALYPGGLGTHALKDWLIHSLNAINLAISHSMRALSLTIRNTRKKYSHFLSSPWGSWLPSHKKMRMEVISTKLLLKHTPTHMLHGWTRCLTTRVWTEIIAKVPLILQVPLGHHLHELEIAPLAILPGGQMGGRQEQKPLLLLCSSHNPTVRLTSDTMNALSSH